MTKQEWIKGIKEADDKAEYFEDNLSEKDVSKWSEGDLTENTDALVDALIELTGDGEIHIWGVSKGTTNWRGEEKTCDVNYYPPKIDEL